MSGPVYYEDMSDQAEAARQKLRATELFKYYGEMEKHAMTGHLDYGKWLIASLLGIHGGAIYAISQLRHDVKDSVLPSLISAVSWNVIGICAIILAAIFAWLNFQFAERLYGKLHTRSMLYINYPETHSARDWRRILCTFYLVITLVLSSLGLFAWSAYMVISALRAVV